MGLQLSYEALHMGGWVLKNPIFSVTLPLNGPLVNGHDNVFHLRGIEHVIIDTASTKLLFYLFFQMALLPFRCLFQ